ncbi:MAG: PAS domain-containing protein [Candidatus Sulfobium sp.]|jgi:transcriptional regulator with PAS, ATPase and Fis domain
MKVHISENKTLFKKDTGDCLCGLPASAAEPGEGAGNISRSGEDWKDIFDTLTDMVTVHDNNFRIIGANAAAERVLGLPSLTANAKCYQYYHGSEHPPEGCPSCRCLSTGKPATFEVYEPHLKMYVEIRAIPRYGSDNRLIGLVHIVRDITRRKQVEEELEIHRHHIEWLVKQRTAEISFSNEQLRREIAERKRVEAETERLIRELKDLLRTTRH